MKFSPGNRVNASLTLGEAFTKGDDDFHFCKPTDVAVREDGLFFVSDGYCNARIILFDQNGKVRRNWGSFSQQGVVKTGAVRVTFLPASRYIY